MGFKLRFRVSSSLILRTRSRHSFLSVCFFVFRNFIGPITFLCQSILGPITGVSDFYHCTMNPACTLMPA